MTIDSDGLTRDEGPVDRLSTPMIWFNRRISQFTITSIVWTFTLGPLVTFEVLLEILF